MIYTDLGHALKRESDGTWIPKDPANTDYARAVQEVANGGSTIEQPPAPSTASLINAAHSVAYESAKQMALAAIDIDARFKYNIWLIDPNSSAAQKAAIWEVYAWTDALWHEYATVRARILAGDLSARFSFSVPCPFTFWQIAAL